MANEIREYLKGGSRDFDRGYALLCKYCRQPSLLSWVGRKHDMEMLLYNLEKLKDAKPKPEYQVRAEQSRFYRPLAPEPAPAPRKAATSSTPPQQPRRVEVFDPSRISRDDLPEDLQALYDANADDYKILRSYHEKMKLAQTNEERAAIREKVIDVEDHIKERWQILDRALQPGADRKEICVSTHRAYISKLLKRDVISQSQQYELQMRVYALLEAGETLSDQTIKRLQEKGFKTELK